MKLETYEQGEAMPYVTSVERIGIKKGILIGQEEGRQVGIPQSESQILRRQLTHRFGPLRIPVGAIHEVPLRADRILDAESLETVFRDHP